MTTTAIIERVDQAPDAPEIWVVTGYAAHKDIHVLVDEATAARIEQHILRAAEEDCVLQMEFPDDVVIDAFEWLPCPLCGADDQLQRATLMETFVATECTECHQTITSSTLPPDVDIADIISDSAVQAGIPFP